MFVNGILFIKTISRHMKFMIEEHISNAEVTTLQESIRQVKYVYMQQGFKITNILTDRQFTCIRGNLAELQINLKVCSNYEHVRETYQLNRTVKERVRGIYNTITLKKNRQDDCGNRRPCNILDQCSPTYTICGGGPHPTPDCDRDHCRLHQKLPPPIRIICASARVT